MSLAKQRSAELAGKVDDFFRRVASRHGDQMQCSTGCSDCCHVRLTVTSVEAAAIQDWLDSLAPADRAAVAERARQRARDRTDVCVALDDGGRCEIYPARPLVCRSHGVPIRTRPAPESSLPVIDVCFRNFTGAGAQLEDADILDQRTLSTILAAVDAAFAGETGGERGARVDLADCLTEL